MADDSDALEVKVGALVLVALILLGGFVLVLGDFSFGSGQRYTVVFDNAAGLKPGADVAIAGLNVGQVESLSFMRRDDPDSGDPAVSVRATVQVSSQHAESIRKGSEFYISTRSVLGEPYIEVVTPSLDAPPLAPGSTIEGISPPRTDLLVSKTSELLDSLLALLENPDFSLQEFLTNASSLVGRVDQVVIDNRDNLDGLLSDARETARHAAGLTGALNRALGEGDDLGAALANFESVARRADSIAGAFQGRAEPIAERLEATTEHARNLTESADELVSDNRESIDTSVANIEKSTENVRELTGDADRIVTKIEQGEGTVGQLLQDREIYEDLREILRIVKRQPWKIMWKE